jgi:hypothetical protein
MEKKHWMKVEGGMRLNRDPHRLSVVTFEQKHKDRKKGTAFCW